jgi:hypothetical protein
MTTDEAPKTSQPFQFYSRLHLRELTGVKAKNLKELVSFLKVVPDAVIYHHTHHFLQQHQSLSPEPTNDFSHWVTFALNEVELGEKLASINAIEFPSIQELRAKIVSTIENFLEKTKRELREANEGQELYFLKSISFIFPTPYQVTSLEEFVAALEKVTTDSIYFHMFEARLYRGKGTNDFSIWCQQALGETELAKQISRLDSYTYTLEGLRGKIIALGRARLKKTA